ncbi:MAG: phosphoesterase [Acidobacteria bacterium]|nr:phosphoesterase [Acidobacteriota bacterium]MBI3655584.1 phosphoesterase [Acidobacteriota bacterium]
MKVRIFYHDNCFDGLASAAVFSQFYKLRFDPQAEFCYAGLTHKAGGQNFHDLVFDGDENVIVDFRYYSSDRLTWWFDHHQSAFSTPEDEQHFLRDTSGKKFYDPQFRSCTKFIATIAAERFGFDTANLKELIHWADTIDGAQYPDPETAVDISGPAMQLLIVIETCKDPARLTQLIQAMRTQSLPEIAQQPYVADQFRPLYERHLKSMETIRQSSHVYGKVIFFDVSEHSMEGYNKFIPYYLHPSSVYSVSISHSPNRTKVSVGFNPWSPLARVHNLASICERYGGGGHAVVAAISYGPDDQAIARKAAQEIIAELNR